MYVYRLGSTPSAGSAIGPVSIPLSSWLSVLLWSRHGVVLGRSNRSVLNLPDRITVDLLCPTADEQRSQDEAECDQAYHLGTLSTREAWRHAHCD